MRPRRLINGRKSAPRDGADRLGAPEKKISYKEAAQRVAQVAQ